MPPPGESFGGPADCAVAAAQNCGLRDDAALVELCTGADVRAAACLAASAHAALSTGLGLSRRALLCAGANSSYPAACAAAAPSAKALGTGLGLGGSVGGSARAAEEAGGGALVGLCRGATSVTPGACARHALVEGLTPHGLDRCREALSVPTALRLDAMWWDGISAPVTNFGHAGAGNQGQNATTAGAAAEAEAFAAAAAAAAGRSKSGAYAWALDGRGAGLFSGRFVHARLAVVDQFGVVLNAEDCPGCRGVGVPGIATVVATASVPKSTAHGEGVGGGVSASLEGIRVNSSGVEGTVEFHALHFSASGLYDLRFSLASTGGASSERRVVSGPGSVAVRVQVAAHADDGLGPLGRCGRALYPWLVSFRATTAFGEALTGGSTVAPGEAVALLPMPFAASHLYLLHDDADDNSDAQGNGDAAVDGGDGGGEPSVRGSCGAALAAAGFRASLGWGGDLWVRFRPAVVALDSDVGLPTKAMAPHERLGLSHTRGALRAVRKAYYRASLLWHPDRWASFPLAFQRRAADCFELVSEAYRELTEEPAGAKAGSKAGTRGAKRTKPGADGQGAPVILMG